MPHPESKYSVACEFLLKTISFSFEEFVDSFDPLGVEEEEDTDDDDYDFDDNVDDDVLADI